MIYTFSLLHSKLVDYPEISKKLGSIMMRAIWQRIHEVANSGGIPFLLIVGYPDDSQREMKLGWFFPEGDNNESGNPSRAE